MTGLWLVSYVALWFLFIVVSIVLLSVLHNLGALFDSVSISRRLQPSPTKLKAGEKLPDLLLQQLSGGEVSLYKFNGVKTAISIVSAHCSPCRELMKAIAEGRSIPDPLDNTVKHQVIVSVGEVNEMLELSREIGLPRDLPVLIDREHKTVTDWGVTATPTTVIVDDRFKVVRQIFGGGAEAPAAT